jgi:hypothetical protein
MHAWKQPDQPDDDQIDCHDVIQQSRHHQNQDAGDESDQGRGSDMNDHGITPKRWLREKLLIAAIGSEQLLTHITSYLEQ